jgi:dipeptidyl aminopeptidase/acylaminoacyl peptidase
MAIARDNQLFRVLLAMCATTLTANAQSQTHRFTLEDMVAVEPINQAALSPDGKTVALVRASQIVLLPSEGGWPVPLTTSAGGKAGLNWSPDGRQLAYTSQGSIWTVAVSGGQPKRLTNTPAGPGDPRQAGDRAPQWSPQGRWILFESGRKGHSDLLVVSEDGRTETLLTQSGADATSATWSPDGKHIAFTMRSPEFFSGRLEVVSFQPESAAIGDPVTLYSAPEDRGGSWSLGKPAWSPDSKQLAVVLQESGWDNVYLIPSAGGKPKALTHGSFEDTDPVFSPDGRSIAVVSTRRSLEQRDIWIVPVDGSAPRELAQSATPGFESAPQWSADGRKIFFLRSSPVASTDLLAASVTGHEAPQYLTRTLPKMFDGALSVPEKVEFKSKDGTSITGILYKPGNLNPQRRYPAVLWIHGGPEGQDGFHLDLWAQYLSQQGYVVLEPNYRGSSGYGEKFRNLNVEDSGGGEVEDVAAGAQYLITRGLADAKRLAIGGGSHGGTMVAYAVVKYPDLFAAAIEMYGVVDRASFVERTNRSSAIRWMKKMGGSPDEKPDVYRRANVLLDVARIHTPLLILHGENDPQVPPYESIQFTRALKQNQKVFYYFTYPNELHGFSQREHRLDAWRKELAFLEKYIQPRYGQSSTSLDDFLLTMPKRSDTPANPAEP